MDVEQETFTPLVFTTTGDMGEEFELDISHDYKNFDETSATSL